MTILNHVREISYNTFQILMDIIKNPYRAIPIFIIQPLCILILSTSLIKGLVNVPDFPAEEIARKVILYGLAIAGITISAAVKYSTPIWKSRCNITLTSAQTFANLFTYAVRLVIMFGILKAVNIPEFNNLFFPPLIGCMIST